MITAFACLATSMFCRCTTTKYVPMVQYKEKVVCKTDTFLQKDSVWIHDSISVYQKGDTIFKDRWRNAGKNILVYKNKADTIYIHDSIPYKVEVEKQAVKTIKYTDIFKLSIWIAILALLIFLYVLYTRKKK